MELVDLVGSNDGIRLHPLKGKEIIVLKVGSRFSYFNGLRIAIRNSFCWVYTPQVKVLD